MEEERRKRKMAKNVSMLAFGHMGMEAVHPSTFEIRELVVLSAKALLSSSPRRGRHPSRLEFSAGPST
jgi:hypothetical protein